LSELDTSTADAASTDVQTSAVSDTPTDNILTTMETKLSGEPENPAPVAEAVPPADTANGAVGVLSTPTAEEQAKYDAERLAWQGQDQRTTALSLSVASAPNFVRSDAEILQRADAFAAYIAGPTVN
jgi:hypothetical protein